MSVFLYDDAIAYLLSTFAPWLPEARIRRDKVRLKLAFRLACALPDPCQQGCPSGRESP